LRCLSASRCTGIAARVGISKCQFKPATKAGKPIDTKQKVQYVWTLE